MSKKNLYEAKSESHPSYTLASFTRVTGMRDLFGTNLTPDHYFRFRLTKAKRIVSQFGDTECRPDTSEGNLSIIEFCMSANQFAELITTMNIGEGVPATLTYVNGEKIETCPPQFCPLEAVIDQGLLRQEELTAELNAEADEAIALLSGKNPLNKEQKDKVIKTLQAAISKAKSSGEFYKKQIEEVGEKTKTEIKTEIDAFATSMVNKIGLEVLKPKNRNSSIASVIEDVKQESIEHNTQNK